jgi:hypothetical protein
MLELPCPSVLKITKVHLSWPVSCSCVGCCICHWARMEDLDGDGSMEIFGSLERLPNLKAVAINLECVHPGRWELFLIRASNRLWKNRKISMSISIAAVSLCFIQSKAHGWGTVGKTVP